MNRPPIDPTLPYTVLSQTTARKHLSTDYGIARHETSDASLEQLHDLLTEKVPEGLGGHFVIITDKAFKRYSHISDQLLAGYRGADVEPGTAVSTLSRAREMIEEKGVEIPEDADRDSLEDVLSAIKQIRYTIVSDEDFSAYIGDMTRLLADMPTGRAKG